MPCEGVALGDSPAIDQIPPALGQCGVVSPYDVDQREFSRPYGTDCDIGAFERNTATAVELVEFTATRRPFGNLVHWETASETDTVGFNLWRLDPEAGDQRPADPR